MFVELENGSPDVDASAWVAPTVVLAGAVRLAAAASVWFGSVLRADGDTISIGERSNVQDGTVIHADPGFPVSVGDDVSIGHGAVLHGCAIGDGALVGMRATVLNGATVGPQCLVAAGAVVLEGSTFEARSLIAGVPAKRRRALTDQEVAALRANAGHYEELVARYREAPAD